MATGTPAINLPTLRTFALPPGTNARYPLCLLRVPERGKGNFVPMFATRDPRRCNLVTSAEAQQRSPKFWNCCGSNANYCLAACETAHSVVQMLTFRKNLLLASSGYNNEFSALKDTRYRNGGTGQLLRANKVDPVAVRRVIWSKRA